MVLAKIFQSNLKIILIFTIVGGLSGFAYSSFKGGKYEGQATLYVKRELETPNSTHYNYDGFYGYQVSKEYTDTVVGLLKTINPYLQTALSLESVRADELFSNTKVKKVSPQVITLTYNANTENEVRTNLTALVNNVVEKIRNLNKDGDSKITIEAVNKDPYVYLSNRFLIINTALGFLVGMFISTAGFALSFFLTPRK